MSWEKTAELLLSARQNRSPIPQLTHGMPKLTVAEAYQIQASGLKRALAAGERLAGYKMGLTSRAKQKDVGVTSTIRGYLLKSMEAPAGESFDTGTRIHPRAEPEVAVVMRKRLVGRNLTTNDVRDAIGWIGSAIEVVDSRYENFVFRLPDVVADNTSASGFMLGTKNFLSEITDIRLTGIVVKKNGEIVETGCPAAVLGDPLQSVVELAHDLTSEGLALDEGMLVLTGGITASVPFQKGDRIEVVWPSETLAFEAR